MKPHAEWIEGRGIVITDETGAEVKATYGATSDGRTCYGHIPALGFFGWQWPSPPLPFKTLIDLVNAGRFHQSTSDLPQLGGPNSCGPRKRR